MGSAAKVVATVQVFDRILCLSVRCYRHLKWDTYISILARAKAFYRGAMVSYFERWLAIAAVVAAAVLSVVFSNWADRL
jgi:hypothetical protein